MELTPKLLETQHFPERFRGYDPDAVDDFLERVAALEYVFHLLCDCMFPCRTHYAVFLMFHIFLLLVQSYFLDCV